MRFCLTIFAVAFILTAEAMEFPGPNPGKAHSKSSTARKEYTLSNNVVAASWREVNGEIVLSSIKDKLSGKTYPQSSAPFELYTPTFNGPISDWKITGPPRLTDLKAERNTSSHGRSYRGKALIAGLTSPSTGINVKLTTQLRDGAGYVRTSIELSGADAAPEITKVQLLNDLKMDAPVQVGRLEKGSPVRSKQMFFGVEIPFSQNSLKEDRINSGVDCRLDLKKGSSYTFSSVIGVFPKDQFRRSLLHYIERERTRSYKPFLHYNCWFDLERRVNETSMLDRINRIHHELGEKRGVKVTSYVVDDGYDDYSKGFWVFNEKKFPNGFTSLAKRLNEIDSNLGIWLSPGGGYQGNGERRVRAKEIGIESLDLSNSKYYAWFMDRHARFIEDEQVNYFKWDKLGHEVSGHFMALMDIAHKLRALNPQLFINTTVGTWQSPFWLHHVDCTWRGGQDMGFIGKGCNREQWLTYRDSVSYKAMAESDFTYPLNALMNHGIVYSDGHNFPRKALAGSDDLRNEVRSYFGGGYALQELYINPHIMQNKHWDAIAEGASWAQRRAAILVDAHFIGGNPNKLEVYGFAAWRNDHGTITLRNPNDMTQAYKLNLSEAFEIPEDACQDYLLKSPYSDQRIDKLTVMATESIAIELKPFEVLVFDASPNNIEQENSRDKK